MYPAFSPGVPRYGLTTTAASTGEVTVSATTADPQGIVLVNGRLAQDGQATLEGLEPGDEISVIFQDSGGSTAHSLTYLPAQFPRITESVPATGATAPGHVLLNLSRYALGSPNFETALDEHGVPAYVRSFPNTNQSADLKPGGAPGHYTVARSPTPTSGRTGSQIVELDSQFREVPGKTHETVGQVDTDLHDSIVRPDGSRILIGYEPNSVGGLTDAVIQEVDAQGEVVYTWNSADHLDPATETAAGSTSADYAHINSIQVMADGDIFASFRLFSSVMKIAWKDHDGYERGDIVWRLGGRFSDFDFVDDPDGGPCAQHTATQLANGHIPVFDNGSAQPAGLATFCVDQSDPEGAPVNRPHTRVAEYALDTQADTATLAWSYQIPGRCTLFAGSAWRLGNGNTLVGWAADTRAIATEVNAAGTPVWELKNDDGYFAYRVTKASVPDTIDPVVDVEPLPGTASYSYRQVVTTDFDCTDRGGSTLQSCQGTRTLPPRRPGLNTFTVRATDGDGNTTVVSRSYTVAQPPPVYRVDGAVRRAGDGWVGNNVYGSYVRQRVTQTVRRSGATATFAVRVQNEGNRPDTVSVRGTGGTSSFSVTYFAGRANVTGHVRAGTWRPTVAAGKFVDLRLVVKRLRPATPGTLLQVVVSMVSGKDGRARDAVANIVRATR